MKYNVEELSGFTDRDVGKLEELLNAAKAEAWENWKAEQWGKLENAKNATIDAFNRAGTWTKEHAQAAYTAISNWFDEMGQKMSQAWENFKETVGQKWENFKGAMSEFGEKVAEMWGKAMDSLGKLWDDIKIGAHNVAVDLKTGVLNLCTDMQCGVANLGIGMQKAGLAMDDAYQQVKGTISGAIYDKFYGYAGQLCTESTTVIEGVIKNKTAELEKFKSDCGITTGEDGKNVFPTEEKNGLNPKTIKSSFEHQESVIADLRGQQQELTSKMMSRETVRDYMEGVKDGAGFKIDDNRHARETLNKKSERNEFARDIEKGARNLDASRDKKSYREKVEADRNASKGASIGGK